MSDQHPHPPGHPESGRRADVPGRAAGGGQGDLGQPPRTTNIRRRTAPDARMRSLLLALGAVLFVVGFGGSIVEWSSGAQPWGQLLGDNFWFARTLPFTIGLGVVLG